MAEYSLACEKTVVYIFVPGRQVGTSSCKDGAVFSLIESQSVKA